MHTGAYWDPGMEFDCKLEYWDKPFSGTRKKDYKVTHFRTSTRQSKDIGYPIVMVYRNDYECHGVVETVWRVQHHVPQLPTLREPRQDVGTHTGREPGHDAVHQRQQGQNHKAKGQRGPLQATRNKFSQQRTTT